jgi:Outer membrane protein beta-barrel domain
MNRRSPLSRAPLAAALTAALLICAAGTALAQQTSGQNDQQERYEQHRDRDLRLGLGIGLVKPDGDAEPYLSAALRFRVGHVAEEPVWDGDSYRGRPPADTGIRGYLEPEISYWSRSQHNNDLTDLLLGINLIGVVPTRGADFSLGVGFGYHFFDSEFIQNSVLVKDNDDRLGGNLQVGVDVNLNKTLALFGTGRLDILEGTRDNRQTKVYVGLRFKL